MKIESVSMQTKLMVLWIFVKLNVLSADLLSFLNGDFLRELIEKGTAEGVVITPSFLLIAGVLLEVNIAMILVSRLSKFKINRLLNRIAPLIVIPFIIVGGSLAPHYIFFASVEVIALIVILVSAWRWKENN